MKKDNLVLPAILLCIICLVTTGLVSLTFVSTQAARDRQAELTANANRRQLCPDADVFEPIKLDDAQTSSGLIEAFTALDGDGETIAWLVSAQSKGYGGQVPVLVVIGKDGRVSGLKVLDNSETPGLGKKAANQPFAGQFVGEGADRVFAVKDAGEGQVAIDAVAGATISSRAVTAAVNLALSFYRQTTGEVNEHGG